MTGSGVGGAAAVMAREGGRGIIAELVVTPVLT